MRVFIGILTDYDVHDIVGVYTTYEAAEKAAEDARPEHIFYPSVYVSVEEYELNVAGQAELQDTGGE